MVTQVREIRVFESPMGQNLFAPASESPCINLGVHIQGRRGKADEVTLPGLCLPGLELTVTWPGTDGRRAEGQVRDHAEGGSEVKVG